MHATQLKEGRCIGQCSKSNIGPKGRNVIISKSFGAPLATKDGATAAKEIELKMPRKYGRSNGERSRSKTNDLAETVPPAATVLAIVKEGT